MLRSLQTGPRRPKFVVSPYLIPDAISAIESHGRLKRQRRLGTRKFVSSSTTLVPDEISTLRPSFSVFLLDLERFRFWYFRPPSPTTPLIVGHPTPGNLSQVEYRNEMSW
jgi:hypothetical protein